MNTNNDIIDIQLKSLRKQRFRINGDDNSVLELNTSDMGIIARLSELYPKLQEMADKAALIGADDDKDTPVKEQIDKFATQLREIDISMREYIDLLFDSNVSAICAPFGTMYDIVEGQFRFDDIIDNLSDLYAENIAKEMVAFKSRMSKAVNKYVPQDHLSKQK